MSSILLSNPFVTPVPPPSGEILNTTPALAVAPLQGTTAGGDKGNATSYSGSGSGQGGGGDQRSVAALVRNRARDAIARPPNATGTSVINAQTQTGDDVVPFGSNLPKVDMPDPLPTSPFLLRMSDKS